MARPKPRPPERTGDILDKAVELVAFLRKYCDWDARQTPKSLAKHLIEESHEVVDAITAGDDDALAEELGDLLLNLAFQLAIAEEGEAFERRVVWHGLEQKMKRRHPHLFGIGPEESWESLKAREKAPESVLDGLAKSLPPLHRAFLVQRRASRVGFDWGEAAGALAKVREEIDEVTPLLDGGHPSQDADAALEEEVGDLLFSVVNLARLAGLDPSRALALANTKFEGRFRAVETLAREREMPMPGTALEALDELWDEVKASE